MQVKDVFELGNHLRRELLLLQIVATLDYATNQAEALLVRQTTEIVVLSDLEAHLVERLGAEQALRLQVRCIG